jgi:flagellar hook-associated protein 2
MISNNMRIGGLASGMDIDQIVKDLMKVERMPLDKLKLKKQLLEWQRDDYRSMNTLLQDLDSYIFNNLSLQSSMLKKKVS